MNGPGRPHRSAATPQPLPIDDSCQATAQVPTDAARPAEEGCAGHLAWDPTQLAQLVTRHRFTYRDEQQLHDGLAGLFADHQVPVRREVRLRGNDRIDFLAGRIGIEVKTHGSPTTVARQLQRYAGSDDVDALMLITAVARHTTLPSTIGGKPLLIVSLLEAAL